MDGPVLVLRVVLALACVVGLIWLASRKFGGAQGRRKLTAPEMQVVSRQVFGRHSGVAVLAVGNRRLLLGYGEQQVTMLTELAPVADTAPHLVSAHGHAVADTASGPLGARRAGQAPVLAAVPSPPSPSSPRPDLDIDAVLAQARVDAGRPAPSADRAGAGDRAVGEQAAADLVAKGPLDGSILSPATWRRAVNVLQDRTVRR